MHQFPVTVYYDETDLGAIVYHATYMKFIDRARADWVRGLGVDQNALRDEGMVFVVHKIEAEFLASARLEDRLVVTTDVLDVTRSRLFLDQRVFRGETLLFRARVSLVLMSLDGHPRRLPDALRALGCERVTAAE